MPQLWQPSLPDEYRALSDDDLARRITARRAELGDDLIIRGLHHQVHAAARHADLTAHSPPLPHLAARDVQPRGAQ